jgi:hypothetical protein
MERTERAKVERLLGARKGKERRMEARRSGGEVGGAKGQEESSGTRGW